MHVQPTLVLLQVRDTRRIAFAIQVTKGMRAGRAHFAAPTRTAALVSCKLVRRIPRRQAAVLKSQVVFARPDTTVPVRRRVRCAPPTGIAPEEPTLQKHAQ